MNEVGCEDSCLRRGRLSGLVPAFLLLVALIFAVLGTFRNYGVSWDEYYRYLGGEQKLAYYSALLSGDSERIAALRAEGDKYPGLFDLSLAILRRVSPIGPVETGHLFSAIFGLLGIMAVYLASSRLAGQVAGLLAALILALLPSYWGHMFFNPKDIPFAATYMLGLWGILRLDKAGSPLTVKDGLVFGIIAGASMATRIGGLLLYAYAGLFGAFLWWKALRKSSDDSRLVPAPQLLRSLVIFFGISGGVGVLILLIFWPAAHSNPFSQVTSTVQSVSQFTWTAPVLYQGVETNAADLPWHYPLVWIFRSVPDLWFVVLLLAVFSVAFQKGFSPKHGRQAAKEDNGDLLGYGLLALAAIFPVCYVIARDSTLYDGVRHLLFIFPPIAALLGAVLYRSLLAIRRFNRTAMVAALGLLVLAVGDLLFSIVRLHPYEYIYVNRLTGGVSAAQGKYELDYWGLAYREAVAIVARDLPDGETATVAMVPEKGKIFVRYERIPLPPRVMVEYWLPENVTLVEAGNPADYYIGINRFGFIDMIPGETVDVIWREGVPLAKVTKDVK